jgi:hypothetical protein
LPETLRVEHVLEGSILTNNRPIQPLTSVHNIEIHKGVSFESVKAGYGLDINHSVALAMSSQRYNYN